MHGHCALPGYAAMAQSKQCAGIIEEFEIRTVCRDKISNIEFLLGQ